MTLEIEIAAPVERVFDYVTDVETHPVYADFVASVEITSSLKQGAGVKFVQVHKGDSHRIPSEIVEHVPHEKVVWLTHGRNGDTVVSYWFRETAKGTKVIHSVASQAFNDEQAYQRSYDNNVRELANLKKVLEGK